MSILSQIQQTLNSLVTWRNEVVANSKRTEELESETNPSADDLIRISRDGESKKAKLEDVSSLFGGSNIKGIPRSIYIDWDDEETSLNQKVINYINSSPIFEVAGTELILFRNYKNQTQYQQESYNPEVHTWMFLKGRGTYGSGSDNPITENDLYYFGYTLNDYSKQEYNLGEIGNIPINSFIDSGNETYSINAGTYNVFLAERNGEEFIYLYTGSAVLIGNVDEPEVNETSINDFFEITGQAPSETPSPQQWLSEEEINELINQALENYYTAQTTDDLLLNKVDKVEGKGLSTEDLTTALYNKLVELESSKFLGQYTSLSELETEHPSPPVGSYAYVDGGVGEDVVKYLWDSNDSQYIPQLGESAEETPATILSKFLQNPDAEFFTTAYKTQLDNLVSDLAGKLNTGGYSGTAQDIVDIINNLDLYTSTNFDEDFAGKTTDNLQEGTNNKYNVQANLNQTDDTADDYVNGRYGRKLVTASRNLDNTDNNKTLIIKGTVTLTFPSTIIEDFNFNFKVKQGGNLTIANGGKTLLDTEENSETQIVAEEGTFGTVYQFETNTFIVEGI